MFGVLFSCHILIVTGAHGEVLKAWPPPRSPRSGNRCHDVCNNLHDIYLVICWKAKTKESRKHQTIKYKNWKKGGQVWFRFRICVFSVYILKIACRRKISSGEGRKSIGPRRLFTLKWVFLTNYINKSYILKHRLRTFESTWESIINYGIVLSPLI